MNFASLVSKIAEGVKNIFGFKFSPWSQCLTKLIPETFLFSLSRSTLVLLMTSGLKCSREELSSWRCLTLMKIYNMQILIINFLWQTLIFCNFEKCFKHKIYRRFVISSKFPKNNFLTIFKNNCKIKNNF